MQDDLYILGLILSLIISNYKLSPDLDLKLPTNADGKVDKNVKKKYLKKIRCK